MELRKTQHSVGKLILELYRLLEEEKEPNISAHLLHRLKAEIEKAKEEAVNHENDSTKSLPYLQQLAIYLKLTQQENEGGSQEEGGGDLGQEGTKEESEGESVEIVEMVQGRRFFRPKEKGPGSTPSSRSAIEQGTSLFGHGNALAGLGSWPSAFGLSHLPSTAPLNSPLDPMLLEALETIRRVQLQGLGSFEAAKKDIASDTSALDKAKEKKSSVKRQREEEQNEAVRKKTKVSSTATLAEESLLMLAEIKKMMKYYTGMQIEELGRHTSTPLKPLDVERAVEDLKTELFTEREKRKELEATIEALSSKLKEMDESIKSMETRWDEYEKGEEPTEEPAPVQSLPPMVQEDSHQG